MKSEYHMLFTYPKSHQFILIVGISSQFLDKFITTINDVDKLMIITFKKKNEKNSVHQRTLVLNRIANY